MLDKYDGWTPPDLSLLQLGLETLDRRGQCRERITAEGIVHTTPRGGMKPHPLLRVERDTTMAVLAIFRQLGLSAPMMGDKSVVVS